MAKPVGDSVDENGGRRKGGWGGGEQQRQCAGEKEEENLHCPSRESRRRYRDIIEGIR